MDKWVSMLKTLPQNAAQLSPYLEGDKDFAAFLSVHYIGLPEKQRRELERNLTTRKGSVFLNTLQSSRDRGPREWAVELAELLPAELRIPRLLDGLGDKDDEIKLLASRALGRLNSLEVVKELVNGLIEGRWLPARVAEALVYIGEIALPYIQQLAKCPEEKFRLYAVEILEQVKIPAAGEMVLQLLSDKSPKVRKKAVGALTSFPDVFPGPVLAQALSTEEDLATKLQIIRVLGRLRARFAKELLEELLNSDDPRIVETVKTSLGNLP